MVRSQTLCKVALLAAGALPSCGASTGPSVGTDGGAIDVDSSVDFSFDGSPRQVSSGPGTTGGATIGTVSIDGGSLACQGSPPIVPLPRKGALLATCTGQIAATLFDHAVCTCEDANIAGYLETDSYHSLLGPFVPGKGGGPVGVNGNYLTAGYAHVGGSFTVAGTRPVIFAGDLWVGGDARFQAGTQVAGLMTVGRDAWMGGDFSAIGVTHVKRDLHLRPGAHINGINVNFTDGKTVTEAFPIDPPCRCGDSEIIDAAPLVDDARLHNDNGSIGLDPHALDNVIGLARLTLPCGRYYLDSIGGVGAIQLHVSGKTVLFVEHDVVATGLLSVRLDPGAELDLFIKGDLVVVGAAIFGNRDRAAATRIYVAGQKDIAIAGFGDFVGNLYAPRSNVTIVGLGAVFGSVFAKNLTAPGALIAHYDRAVLDFNSAKGCAPPAPPVAPAPPGTPAPPAAPPPQVPPVCQKCGDCTGGSACVGTSCGPCTVDSDCCGPLVCVAGTCDSLVK